MLTSLPELESVAQKLIQHFESEKHAYDALIEGNISEISQIEGITLRRAVNLSMSAIGEDAKFLSTKEAEKIFQALVSSLSERCLTKAGKDRLQLMLPKPQIR